MISSSSSGLSRAASVDLLLSAQTDRGAIPASTEHEIYQFGWLRDGSWCFYALDRAGYRAETAAWHHWVAETLLRHASRFDEALEAVRLDRVDGRVMLPARFTLDGHEEEPGDGEEEWPNFQTDCYGFWLWALADHVARGGTLDETTADAARLVVRYLMGAGETPCFDCWEEHPGNLHASSLAAVVAGLRDAGRMLGGERAVAYAERLRARLLGAEFTLAGSFVRFPGDTRVDGSLLWLAVPLGVVDLDDPVYRATVSRVRDELHVPGGGVRRYLGDTFYGGSEWILLAATLGWVGHRTGEPELAEQLLEWIEASATPEGHLPESVTDRVQSPHMLAFWREKWGVTATPLLWSHAMHVILRDELASREAGGERATG